MLSVNRSKISPGRAQISEIRFFWEVFVTNRISSYKPGLLVYFGEYRRKSIFGIKSLVFCRIFPGEILRVFFATPLSKLRLNFPLADRTCVNFEPAGEFRLGKRDFGFSRSLGLSNREQIWFFLLCF